MADETTKLSVFITAGAESAGLAIARACAAAGRRVTATASDSPGAMAIRQAGALPVYPDLCRESELRSALRMCQADVVVHAAPQILGGVPQADVDHESAGGRLLMMAEALAAACQAAGVKQVIALSYAWLYDSSHGESKEGSHDLHDSDFAHLLSAEAALQNSDLNGFVLRSGCIYGGKSAGTLALAEDIKRSRALPDGDHPASWIHEDDLAAAVLALMALESAGMQIVNAAADSAHSPNDFAIALSETLGLGAPDFRRGGWRTILRGETMRDKLLNREVRINSGVLGELTGWRPRHADIRAGLDAAALVWRMQDAVNPRDYYERYEDKAAAAIDARQSGIAIAAPVVEEQAPAKAEAVERKPAPVKAAPPPSDGPTPWNEDEAKREERKRKALERKAKRAAKRAGGS